MESADLSTMQNTFLRIGNLDQHFVVRPAVRLTRTRNEERLDVLVPDHLVSFPHTPVAILAVKSKPETEMSIPIAIETVTSQELFVAFANNCRERTLATDALNKVLNRSNVTAAEELIHAGDERTVFPLPKSLIATRLVKTSVWIEIQMANRFVQSQPDFRHKWRCIAVNNIDEIGIRCVQPDDRIRFGECQLSWVHSGNTAELHTEVLLQVVSGVAGKVRPQRMTDHVHVVQIFEPEFFL